MKDEFRLPIKKGHQQGKHPKLSMDRTTYTLVSIMAFESGLSMASVTRKCIQYAFERIKYVEGGEYLNEDDNDKWNATNGMCSIQCD